MNQKSAEYKSPAIANSYLGGVLYYLAAIMTIVYSLAMLYEYITVPPIFGSGGTVGLELTYIPIIQSSTNCLSLMRDCRKEFYN